MVNPKEPPGLPGEPAIGPPPSQARRRDAWARLFAAMAWPVRYTLAVGVVAIVAWATASALAWAMTLDMHFHDTYFDFRIGW